MELWGTKDGKHTRATSSKTVMIIQLVVSSATDVELADA